MPEESLLHKAVRIACEAHAGQSDKNGEPILFHVFRVAAAMEGERERILSVVHEVAEDCGWDWTEHCGGLLPAWLVKSLDAISRRIGDGESYAAYIERVAANPLARRVKLADLADNLRPERISALPPEQAASLAKRYHAAYARLSREEG